MPQVDMSPIAEQFVSESDHVQLSRLVIEHGWQLASRRWVGLFARDLVE